VEWWRYAQRDLVMTDTTDRIVSLFEDGGIDTVFGFPCEQMDPYYSSLDDSALRHVLGRSEASAALMADGYARANRTVGVVDGVGGPGAAYIGAGLCEAAGASSPVLALTGDNERGIRGREVIQDADNEAILAPHAEATYDAESADRAVEAVAAAIRRMTTGVPAPAHVNLPGDVFDEPPTDDPPAAPSLSYPRDRPAPNDDRVGAVLDRLERADAPVVLAGEGVVRADAADALAEFAAATNTPVVTSINGKGAVPETDPYALGGPAAGASARSPKTRWRPPTSSSAWAPGSATSPRWGGASWPKRPTSSTSTSTGRGSAGTTTPTSPSRPTSGRPSRRSWRASTRRPTPTAPPASSRWPPTGPSGGPGTRPTSGVTTSPSPRRAWWTN
jgi:hypothetical protein